MASRRDFITSLIQGTSSLLGENGTESLEDLGTVVSEPEAGSDMERRHALRLLAAGAASTAGGLVLPSTAGALSLDGIVEPTDEEIDWFGLGMPDFSEEFLEESQVRASLRGSASSLQRQIRRYRIDDLSKLQDDDLKEGSWFRENGRLVVVDRNTRDHYVHNVAFGRALTRPYAKLFLRRLAQQYRATTGGRLRVTSITRSEQYQRRLRRSNRNATSPDRSPHVRGAAFDISYTNMGRSQRRWMENALLQIEGRGVIEATKERFQPVYHVMVFKSYTGDVQSRNRMSDRRFRTYFRQMTGGVIY